VNGGSKRIGPATQDRRRERLKPGFLDSNLLDRAQKKGAGPEDSKNRARSFTTEIGRWFHFAEKGRGEFIHLVAMGFENWRPI